MILWPSGREGILTVDEIEVAEGGRNIIPECVTNFLVVLAKSWANDNLALLCTETLVGFGKKDE